MPSSNRRDYYAILGIRPTSSHFDIKKARDRLALRYHPDRSRHPQAEEYMQRINQAYDTLSDPSTRGRYDTSLGLHQGKAAATTPMEKRRPTTGVTKAAKADARHERLDRKFAQAAKRAKKATDKARARRRDECDESEAGFRERNGEIHEGPDDEAANSVPFLPRDPVLFIRSLMREPEARQIRIKGRNARDGDKKTKGANPIRLIERHSRRAAPGSEAWRLEKAEAELNQQMWRREALQNGRRAEVIHALEGKLREVKGLSTARKPLPQKVLRATEARKGIARYPAPSPPSQASVPDRAITRTSASAVAPQTGAVTCPGPKELRDVKAEIDNLQLAKIRRFEGKNAIVGSNVLGPLASRAKNRVAGRPYRKEVKDARYHVLTKYLGSQIARARRQGIKDQRLKDWLVGRLGRLGASADIIDRVREGRCMSARAMWAATPWCLFGQEDIFSVSNPLSDARMITRALGTKDAYYFPWKYWPTARIGGGGDKVVLTDFSVEPAEKRKRRRTKTCGLVRGAEEYVPFNDRALTRRVLDNWENQPADGPEIAKDWDNSAEPANDRMRRDVQDFLGKEFKALTPCRGADKGKGVGRSDDCDWLSDTIQRIVSRWTCSS